MLLNNFSLLSRCLFITGFFPLVALVLGADSLWYAEANSEQSIANLLAAIYFLGLLTVLDSQERIMAIIFVPFSALAEYIFSSILEVYTYRLETVPLYVPLGHAILFGTGLMLAKLPAIAVRDKLQTILFTIQALIFAGVIIFWQDIFTAVLGILFGLVIWWRGCRLIYPIMCFLVLYIELLGTNFGCWTWQANTFNIFHTTNPPFGAFVFYVFGDITILKMARFFQFKPNVTLSNQD